MLDEFRSDQPGDYLAGFPEHPHRGFQTVTYMLAGRMRHRDSVGHEGVIGPGAVQWMNAGRGILHSEMPEQQHGLMHGFQLWINLPASRKLSAPAYRELEADQIPELRTASGSLIREVLDEVVAVAAANGIAVDALRIQATVEDALNHHVGHQPSLLQDLLAGRPTETDSIHGAVVRAAERHGIATPMNRALHQLISLAQQRAA